MNTKPHTYPVKYGPIILDDGRTAFAVVGVEHLAPDWLTVAFAQGSAHAELQLRGQRVLRTVPAAFDDNLPHDRLRRMLQWVFKLDPGQAGRFDQNQLVVLRVPIDPPSRSHSPQKVVGTDWYRERRMPSGALIRPLLLLPPDDSPLMDYQKIGVAWLRERRGAILADDMGLGKTVQAITALRLMFNDGMIRSVLIVCPKSLMANWEAECAKWSPELSSLRVSSRSSEREGVWAAILGGIHILLANYEQFRVPPEALVRRGVDLLLLDEAHRTRNKGSAISRGLKHIPRVSFWALTGTPLERDASDFATLLSALDPARFAPSDALANPSILRARAADYVLRRHKDDVLDDLPEVLDASEVIELAPIQSRAYRRALQRRRPKTADSTGADLALVNELREICDADPLTGSSAKIDRTLEILDVVRRSGEKAVLFSYLLRPLYLLKARIDQEFGVGAAELIEGQMSVTQREEALGRFRTTDSALALLASSRVAGEGLTLTEANHVIFINEWWNPSANAQARDRVVRIGQRRCVSIHRFVCRDTVEEALQLILQEKQELFTQLVERLSTAEPGVLGAQLAHRLVEETVRLASTTNTTRV